MKTALVTHTWLDADHHFDRVERWLAYHADFLEYFGGAQMLLIDNGSSEAQMERLIARTARMPDIGTVMVDVQRPSLPRTGLLGYGYTWRMFASLGEKLQQYERIIFAESDFFICSRRMLDWIETQRGLATVYCPRYRFPESAFFVLTRGCREYEEFVAAMPWESRIGRVIEETVPWTHVERDLVGDRYREDPADPPLPSRCDYVAQMPLSDPLPEFA